MRPQFRSHLQAVPYPMPTVPGPVWAGHFKFCSHCLRLTSSRLMALMRSGDTGRDEVREPSPPLDPICICRFPPPEPWTVCRKSVGLPIIDRSILILFRLLRKLGSSSASPNGKHLQICMSMSLLAMLMIAGDADEVFHLVDLMLNFTP